MKLKCVDINHHLELYVYVYIFTEQLEKFE